MSIALRFSNYADGFAPGREDSAYGDINVHHSRVGDLKPGDRIVIEATVRSAGLISVVELCSDFKFRQCPTSRIQLQPDFTFRRVAS